MISDGYQNNLMYVPCALDAFGGVEKGGVQGNGADVGWVGGSRTMTNVLLRKEYPKEYTAAVSTRVSNALLVGEIIGQIVIGSVV